MVDNSAFQPEGRVFFQGVAAMFFHMLARISSVRGRNQEWILSHDELLECKQKGSLRGAFVIFWMTYFLRKRRTAFPGSP